MLEQTLEMHEFQVSCARQEHNLKMQNLELKNLMHMHKLEKMGITVNVVNEAEQCNDNEKQVQNADLWNQCDLQVLTVLYRCLICIFKPNVFCDFAK